MLSVFMCIAMEYSAYQIGPDGHRLPPTTSVAVSDAVAVDQVKTILNGLPIELWQGSRMVGWFQNTSSGLAVVTPPAQAKSFSSDSSPQL